MVASPFAYADGMWHINEAANTVNTPDGKLMCGKAIDSMWRIQWGIPKNVKATLEVKFKMLHAFLNKVPVGIAYMTNHTTGQQFQWHPEDEDEILQDGDHDNHYISEWMSDMRDQIRACQPKDAEDVETMPEVAKESACDPSDMD